MKNNTNEINETFFLDATLAGLRLDQALAKALPHYSRTQIKSWIMAGKLRINGHCMLPKYKVQGGEKISLQAEMSVQCESTAENIPLDIIFEDAALIIVNKPAGMVVHPAPGNRSQTLVNALLHHDPSLALLPRAGIVHRLDKDTSGLLLVAKTADALKELSRQMKKRLITRGYQAIVLGKLISGATISAPIGRHPLLRKQMAVTDTGKPAVTHYRISQKFRGHTHLNIQLETGRTHQIRVHMAHIRHPVLGDPVYSKRLQITKNMTEALQTCIRHFKRQALHAYLLTFRHPSTQEEVSFSSDLPADLKELIKLLKEDASA